jgi:hypothetical protein
VKSKGIAYKRKGTSATITSGKHKPRADKAGKLIARPFKSHAKPSAATWIMVNKCIFEGATLKKLGGKCTGRVISNASRPHSCVSNKPETPTQIRIPVHTDSETVNGN